MGDERRGKFTLGIDFASAYRRPPVAARKFKLHSPEQLVHRSIWNEFDAAHPIKRDGSPEYVNSTSTLFY